MTVSPPSKSTILVVDDVAENLMILSAVLRDEFRTLATTSGREALELVQRDPLPDLVLLDVLMPHPDGFEVCRRLKADPRTADIPVIFLTGAADIATEQEGLDLGAVDYIAKPFNPPLVQARVRAHLQAKRSRDFLKSQNAFLEAEVARRTQEVSTIQDATMVALGSLAETRNNETGAHIRRTQYFVRSLAEALRNEESFAPQLDSAHIESIFKSAPLHDIGKVGIPDPILLKPGPLTAEEFEVMKTHTTLGALAIEKAERLINHPRSFLRVAHQIALTHHERWDGSGYPQGLRGDEIPLAGRIMAVADVYDALRTERVYKPAHDHESTVREMAATKGHFDPRLLSAFLGIHETWKQLYDELTT